MYKGYNKTYIRQFEEKHFTTFLDTVKNIIGTLQKVEFKLTTLVKNVRRAQKAEELRQYI